MGDSKYTELSLPLCSGSNPKSSSGKRTAAKLIAGISGLVIFGYFMSATYFSSPEARPINLNSYEARLPKQLNLRQLELVSTPEKVDEFGNPKYSHPRLTLSKDNSLAAFVNPTNNIEVWDVKKKELVATFSHSDKSDSEVNELTFTPDRKYLISIADSDYIVKIWDLENKSLYGQVEDKIRPSSLFVTNDSKLLAYKTYSGVSFWDITNLSKSHTLKVRDDSRLTNIAITPDKKYLAMAISGAVEIIRVYDINTRKKIATIDHETELYFIKISDDGKIVATGDFGHTIKAWNLETGKLLTKLDFEETVFEVGLSPDGRFVLGPTFSKTTFYDLKADKISSEMDRLVYKYAFTKDSKFLLTPYVRDIHVIDLETNNQVATLEHDYYIEELYLSEDGEYLLVSTDESVYLWNLDNLYN